MEIDPFIYWLVLGILLLIGEMLTVGFFLLFFALGSFGASLAAALGQPIWVQLVACAVLSLVGLAFFRKTFQRKFLKSITLSLDIGKEIQIDKSIPAHQNARILYQGSTWNATNLGSEDIQEGDRVVILGMDGISLLIRKMN